MTPLIIRGCFEDGDGVPIAGAAVCTFFLGAPPRGCGMGFNLKRARMCTDGSGEFRIVHEDPDAMLEGFGPPGTWERGGFFVVAIKDGRTLGCAVVGVDELAARPLRLVVLPGVDIRGAVVDEDGRPVAGVEVASGHYYVPVGRSPNPSDLVNFWIAHSEPEPGKVAESLARFSARTDSEGTFLLEGVPAMPGGMALTLSHPDYAEISCRYEPGRPLPPLVMSPGAVVRMRVALLNGAVPRGFRLRLDPERARGTCGIGGVPPLSLFGIIGREAEIDDNGCCEFRGLSPGDYTIRCGEGSDRGWALPAISIKGLGRGECRVVEELAVPGSILHGRVTDEASGRPVEGAEVRFALDHPADEGSGPLVVRTDARGEFVARAAVIPGRFLVTVRTWRGSRPVVRSRRLIVKHEPRTEVNLVLPGLHE